MTPAAPAAPAAPAPLRTALARLLQGRVVIMGVGNPLRGDDAAGSVVARALTAALQATSPPSAPALATVIDAEEIPESWLGPAVAARPDVILIIDAVELGAPPGATALLAPAELTGEARYTHRTPLRPLISYLQAATGAEVALLGIQPGPARWGEQLGAEVGGAAANLVLLLTDVLQRAAAEAAPPEAIAC